MRLGDSPCNSTFLSTYASARTDDCVDEPALSDYIAVGDPEDH